MKRVILALDNDEPGRRATEALKAKLEAAGIAVRAVSFPEGIKDANELLVSRNGDAGRVFRELLEAAVPEVAATAVARSRASPGHLSLKGEEERAGREWASAHARRRQLPGARPLAAARPATRDRESGEGRGLPRGHDRPLRLAEPVRVCAANGQNARRRSGCGRGGSAGAARGSREDGRGVRRARTRLRRPR